jgi:hypothetical protein
MTPEQQQFKQVLLTLASSSDQQDARLAAWADKFISGPVAFEGPEMPQFEVALRRLFEGNAGEQLLARMALANLSRLLNERRDQMLKNAGVSP